MQLLQNGKQQWIDQNGLPLANGTVGFYAPGTLNPLPTYQDSAGTILNTNPIVLDSRGQAIVWGTGSYRQIVKDASGVTIWDQIAQASDAGSSTLSANLADTTNVGNGDALIGVKQPFSGAVGRTQHSKNIEVLSAADFGFVASNTAAQNLAALKAAIAGVPTGAKLVVPPDSAGGTYLIDATGGLSNACVVNKSMTLQIDGVIQSVGHTQQAGNPMYPIKITAANVLLTGSGTIQGDGTFDTTNSGDETTFPGLVYVDSTANNFTAFGLTIAANPKVGILLNNCKWPVIGGCTFTGGPTSYVTGNTAYFGVRAYQGSGFSFSGNRIVPDAGGGVPIDGIFTLNSTNMLVTGNYAEGLWEKLGYMYTSNSIVSNNMLNYPNGNNADAIRIDGSANLITGNWVINANGGVTVYDGTNNKVLNNVFLNCKQVAVYVTQLSGSYTTGFSDTEICGNYCSAGSGGSLGSGIQFISTGGDSYRVKIIGNTVIGFAPSGSNGQILLQGTSPNFVWDSLVLNNICNGNATGQYGVYATRCNRTLIKNNNVQSTVLAGVANDGGLQNTVDGNTFYNAGAYAMDFGPVTASTACRAINNQSRGATNIGIKNFGGSNNVGSGNQYTDAPLTGTATLAAAVTTTVTHGGVAANAMIFLQEANAAAGSMTATKGRCYTSPSGADFAITVANGNAAAGTEQYFYEIIQ